MVAILAVLGVLSLKSTSDGPVTDPASLTERQVIILRAAVEQYRQDEGEYPGETEETSRTDNQFPVLFNALFGRKKPNGSGGRNSPYTDRYRKDVVVYDKASAAYRRARIHEKYDSRVDKFIVDGWGNPLLYRSNKGRPPGDYMRNPESIDIYSTGPDGIDQTAEGHTDSDDIGNW